MENCMMDSGVEMVLGGYELCYLDAATRLWRLKRANGMRTENILANIEAKSGRVGGGHRNALVERVTGHTNRRGV